MNDEPLAYFLTWTTYGTWLSGDSRGWTAWKRGQQPPDPKLNARMRSRMVESELRLDPEQIQIVEQTIKAHCTHRNRTLHALSVQPNHVHVVVTAPGYRPETVLDQLKAWSTRRLKAQMPSRKHWWTEGASERWINDQTGFEAAIQYVAEAQPQS